MDGSLWVVDPSMSHPEDEGVREVLGDWRGPTRVFQPALRRGDGPTADLGHAADGIVVMGSRASVHDDLPWLADLSRWLRPVLSGAVAVPLFGICFGHQLIAHLAGGEVGFLSPGRDKITGVETSRLGGSRLLPGDRRLRVVVSHREVVRSIPAGYRVVARRDGVPIDGLEHRSAPIFSFQFHPEAREEFAGHASIPAAALDERVRADSEAVLSAFRRVVRDRRRGDLRETK